MAVPLAVLRILLLFVYICEVAACVTEYVTGDRGIRNRFELLVMGKMIPNWEGVSATW
jgi:hypothetical protein